MELVRKFFVFLFDVLESIVVALAIFVVLYLFITQPHQVKGQSMDPNFANGQYILTDKISYHFTVPKRGDVIVFKSPANKEIDFIKRVIGLPGERVRLTDGSFYINGKKLEEKYIPPENFLYPGSFLRENVEITVPAGHLFVTGDNRPHSSDSREFGPIPYEDIVGRSFLRYWPFEDAGLIPKIHYSL